MTIERVKQIRCAESTRAAEILGAENQCVGRESP
jgi:hypothetical protein